MLSAEALVHCGAIGSSIGRSSAIHSRATAHDFGHLSALALASERAPFKTDAIIVDGQFHSGLLGRTDGAKPCDAASSSSADFFHGPSHAFVYNAGISYFVPGWVPGAPLGSSLGTMLLCPPRRQEPFLLPVSTRPTMWATMPLGPLEFKD